MKLIDRERSGHKWLLTVRHGWPSNRISQFTGEHAVWYKYPSGKRASTSTEIALTNLLRAAEWRSTEPSYSTLKRALKELEWNGAQRILKCPACWALRRDDHKEDCWLKRLL